MFFPPGAFLLFAAPCLLGGARADVPVIDSIASPAEVLFTREADTAFQLHYAHLILPLNVSLLDDMLQQLERALGKWHNTTVTDHVMPDLPDYVADPTWFMDSPKFFQPAAYENLHNRHRIVVLRRRLAHMRELFHDTEQPLRKFIRDNADEAHDFTINPVPSSPRTRKTRAAVLPSHPLLSRLALPFRVAKRAIGQAILGAIALIGVLAITFSSLYTAKEIKNMHDSLRLNDLSHTYREDTLGHTEAALARLFTKTLTLFRHYHMSSRESFAATITLDAIERRIQMFEAAITAGLQGRVAAEHFLEVNLPRTAAKIARRARASDMAPLANHVTDWMQFEATLVGTDDGLDVLLHVPLVRVASLLSIYRFHPLPFPLEHGLHLQMDTAPFTHLAIDHNTYSFRGLTLAELNACRSVGLFKLCDLGSVVRTFGAAKADWEASNGIADPELCLYALFAMEFQLAGKVCLTTIGKTRSVMRQIGPNTFAAYSPTPERGTVRCFNNTNPHLSFTTFGLKKITIPFGCWAKTDTHIFTAADDSLTRGADFFAVNYGWETPISDLTRGLNLTLFDILRNQSLALEVQIDQMMSIQKAHALVEQSRLDRPEDPTPLESIANTASDAADGVADWTAERIHSLFGAPTLFLVLLPVCGYALYLHLALQRRVAALEHRLLAGTAAAQPLIIQAGAPTAPPRTSDTRMSYKELLARVQ